MIKISKYPDFLSSTRYGYPDGLKGVNCRHDFFGVDPSVQEPMYSEEELKALAQRESEKHAYETIDKKQRKIIKHYTKYEATQRQRSMETQMRKTRASAVALREAGLQDDYLAEKAAYKRQRKEYERFSQAMDLETDYVSRVYVDGLGKI